MLAVESLAAARRNRRDDQDEASSQGGGGSLTFATRYVKSRRRTCLPKLPSRSLGQWAEALRAFAGMPHEIGAEPWPWLAIRSSSSVRPRAASSGRSAASSDWSSACPRDRTSKRVENRKGSHTLSQVRTWRLARLLRSHCHVKHVVGKLKGHPDAVRRTGSSRRRCWRCTGHQRTEPARCRDQRPCLVRDHREVVLDRVVAGRDRPSP